MIATRLPGQDLRLCVAVLAAVMSLTLGCATDHERERLMQEKYPSYPEEIKRAIDDAYLLVGMDREQVFLVLGKPMCKKNVVRKEKEVEAWFYPPGGQEPCRTAQHRLYFEAGRLLEWEAKIVR